MSYSSARSNITTLSEILEAVNTPTVPNGTTVKINRIINEGVGALVDMIANAAGSVNVPNGTTTKVLRIVERAGRARRR